MRILDLGCGSGRDLAAWGVTVSDEVTGVDINESRLEVARGRFPGRMFVHGAGERLPFEDGRFDRVISSLALPYMKIPQALTEIRRVLVPGGRLSGSLHSLGFTLSEMKSALPHPLPTIYRAYVLANGVWFHLTGKTVRFVNHRTESFQTPRGMTLALKRAVFQDISFKKVPGAGGDRYMVEARKG